jgi:hypothetical protein
MRSLLLRSVGQIGFRLKPKARRPLLRCVPHILPMTRQVIRGHRQHIKPPHHMMQARARADKLRGGAFNALPLPP